MKWIEALKQWNSQKDMWCIPRKGTKEYDEVKAIMTSDKPKEQPKEVKKQTEKEMKEMERMGAEDFDVKTPVKKTINKKSEKTEKVKKESKKSIKKQMEEAKKAKEEEEEKIETEKRLAEKQEEIERIYATGIIPVMKQNPDKTYNIEEGKYYFNKPNGSLYVAEVYGNAPLSPWYISPYDKEFSKYMSRRGYDYKYEKYFRN
jgi:hypothetical protein